MANICDNSLIVVGNSEDIERLNNQFQGEYTKYTYGMSHKLEPKPEYMHHKIINLDKDTQALMYITSIDKKTGYSFNNFIQISVEDILGGTRQSHLWGCTSDCYETYISGPKEAGERTAVCISFCTDWDEPKYVVEEMAKQYPNLEFTHEYVEEAMDYAGIAKYRNGKLYSWETTFDSGLDYRKFFYHNKRAWYYTCTNCYKLYEEQEIYKTWKCECGCTEFYDLNGQIIREDE